MVRDQKGIPHKSYSVADKLRLVELYKSRGGSKSQFAKVHCVPKNTFLGWIANEDDLRKSSNTKNFRRRDSKFPDIEEDIVKYIKWWKYNSSDSGSLSWNMLLARANSFAEQHHNKEFKASTGWLSRTLKRNNIVGLNAPCDMSGTSVKADFFSTGVLRQI